MGPLDGIRIVEIAGLGAAPMCGMMLADLGAEVFVIDRKNDRGAEATLHVKDRDMLNRGKHMLRVDLKQAEGTEFVLDLVEKSQALLESFRPGVMERLGLGPDICLERNNALVYARLTGWGQNGPLAMAAGHDPNYVALTGALYHTGERAGVPQSPPTLLGDAAGGAGITALGICAALIPALHRGQGQVIDAAIGEGAGYLTTLVRSLYYAGQMNDERGSSWMEGAAPWSRAYACADGDFITLLPVEERFYKTLLRLLELEEDSLFKDAHQYDKSSWPHQVARRESLFASKDRDYWCQLLEGTDACFAPVLAYSEVHDHPHNKARRNFKQSGDDWYPVPAPRFSETPHEPDWDGTRIGNVDDVLAGMGFADKTIKSVTG